MTFKVKSKLCPPQEAIVVPNAGALEELHMQTYSNKLMQRLSIEAEIPVLDT